MLRGLLVALSWVQLHALPLESDAGAMEPVDRPLLTSARLHARHPPHADLERRAVNWVKAQGELKECAKQNLSSLLGTRAHRRGTARK